MPELRTGIDLVEIHRLAAQDPAIQARFKARVFTPRELQEVGASLASLAGRFAAKEAVSKALGCGIGAIGWHSIEIQRGAQGEPVLVLHGTAGSSASMLTPAFAGELFGPGQPLDASKYFIVIPDSLGHGKSTKPSDGLRASFPKYDYDDMVDAQYRLVKEGLGLKHLRLAADRAQAQYDVDYLAGEEP